jgi:sec-independent protein translocase protein TatA
LALGDPVQWIIIGVIVVVIFLWGPQKIPDIARALGRAKKEFEDASKEVGNVVETTTTAPKPAPEKTGDQILMETARALGIETAGKTRDQISQEIISKKSQP